MALRESGRKIGKNFNLRGLVEPGVEIGVDGGASLVNFADAVLGDDLDKLNQARAAVTDQLSPAAVAGAAIIAGCFSKNDRIANAIGIPLHPSSLKNSEELREALGVNAYRSAANTLKS